MKTWSVIVCAVGLTGTFPAQADERPEPEAIPSPVVVRDGAKMGHDRVNHALYVELGGPGLLYSLNYEYRFSFPVAIRIGAGAFNLAESGTERNMSWFTMPVTASYLFGRGGHHLELGAGFTTGYGRSNFNRRLGDYESYGLFAGVGLLGYRYQPDDGGFLFRATLSPIYGGERFQPTGSEIQIWGGVSFGYAF